MEPMVLSQEQKESVDYMYATRETGACLLASEVGTGKTCVAIEFCRRVNAKVILIIAPMQTMGAPDEGGWHGTFDQQQIPLKFRQIDSSVAGKKAHADYQWSVPGVYYVGQEMFARMGWTKEPVMIGAGEAKRQKVDKNNKPVFKKVRTAAWHTKADVVIFDEVHRAQNGQSITSKTLLPGPGNDPGVQAKYKIGASGTFYGNSFAGAWAVTRWLFPNQVDASEYVWRAKWCATIYDPFAVRNQKVVGELVEGAFVKSLPCYIRIESNLNIEVDEKNIEVDLYPEQRRVYDELDKMMVAWVEEHPLVTKFPITKRIRQRQATLGMPTLTRVWNEKTSEYDVEVGFDLNCESAKIDSMWSILSGDFENESALIYTDSEKFSEVITHRINDALGAGLARKWSGKVHRKVRDQDKRDFLDGQFRYMVCVIASIGVGTDSLQLAARNILFMSQSDNGVDAEQAVGRLVRRGQEADKVRIRKLLARGTIDFPQNDSLIQAALRRNKSLKRRK